MNNIGIVEGKRSAVPERLDCAEMNNVFQDESGYRMELREVAVGQIKLKWGTYHNCNEKVLTFCPDETTVVSHFRIADPASGVYKSRQGIGQGEFVVYPETPEPYDLLIAPTKGSEVSFFEVGMTDTLFHELFCLDSDFLVRFNGFRPLQTPALDFTASMLPGMYNIIHDMYHTSFTGHLRGLFLEAKTMELFLLQIAQLDKAGGIVPGKLKKRDIACLHEIKEYLQAHFDQPTSIAALSRKAGINSMKLKSGFKALFNTTVFGYLHAVRMQEAKRLLIEEDSLVNEVADRVGYKYPHHFAAAFKKHFHVTPSALRRDNSL